jgi:hypothetical protein
MSLHCEDGSAPWPAAWWGDPPGARARAQAVVWRRGREPRAPSGRSAESGRDLASVPSAPPPRPHFPWRARTNQAVTIRFAKQWHYFYRGLAWLDQRGQHDGLSGRHGVWRLLVNSLSRPKSPRPTSAAFLLNRNHLIPYFAAAHGRRNTGIEMDARSAKGAIRHHTALLTSRRASQRRKDAPWLIARIATSVGGSTGSASPGRRRYS